MNGLINGLEGWVIEDGWMLIVMMVSPDFKYWDVPSLSFGGSGNHKVGNAGS